MRRNWKKKISEIKKILVTCGGVRNVFGIDIAGNSLMVDYNLRLSRPDRDYHVILQLARGKKCVLDVGANHGLISLLVAKQDPAVRVFAFEASEDAVNVINENVRLNSLSSQVRTINSLIADRSGKTISFFWEGSSGGASITKGRLGHTIEIEKSTLSLDDFVLSANLRPDFIKMDIEGAENIAIYGMSFIMEKIKPDIFIELHDFGDKKLFQNAQEILDFARGFGYLMIYLRSGQPIQSADILRERGRCHVLLMPKEHYKPDYFNTLDLSGL